MSGSHGTRQRAARGRGEELRSRRSSCWSLKARPSRGAALQALVRDRRFYPFSLIFRGLGGELMRQAGRSERRTAAVGCATSFPPWREEGGPEAFLSSMLSCLPGTVSRGDGAGGLSVSVTPARGTPGPAATPLLPCVHVTPVFSSCGFCCISGTTGLAAGWGGPRRGPQRETGPAPPCPMVPVRQRPGLRLFRVTQDVVARPPGRVVPPWGAHVRPCSAPQSFRPPSPRSRSRTRRGVSTVPDELGGFSGNVFFHCSS